ncbi:hypothetical protein [Leptospira langatensis]|uniref:hypothetical protein n=1 Tax=Leptospira langatensis TaxID=2484983 RepID=UPI001FE45397|nr:hypothetical protein [Leptospira langatensis]
MRYIILFSLGCNCGFRPSPLERNLTQGPNIPSFVSLPESGEYFSEIKKIPTGFYVRQVYLNNSISKQEMFISQLTVSEAKNWEEIRFEGKLSVDPSGNYLRFRPRLCRIFTSKNPGDRWTLTRAYECDHYEFLIWKSGNGEMRLVPGPEGEEDGLKLVRPKSGNSSQIAAIVLKVDSLITSVWGMRLSRVRRGASVYMERSDGKKVDLKSLQTVETTGEIKTEKQGVFPGDFILYTNPSGDAKPLAL